MQIFRKGYICRWTVSLIIICILLGSIGSFVDRRAKAAESWLEIKGVPNSSQSSKIEDDKIVQTGIHNKARDGAIRYETQYFFMTKDRININHPMSHSYNKNTDKIIVSRKKGRSEEIGNNVITEYYINKSEFLQAISDLGIDGEYIVANNGASVYLHNVFNTVQGSTIRKREVFGYQEMMKAEPWSAASRNYLKGYYNFEYKLTVDNVFDVNIIAIDEEGNILNDNLLSKKVIQNEELIYNLPDAFYEMEVDNITYRPTHWNYNYKERGTDQTVRRGDYTAGFNIRLLMPDAAFGSTLTIHIVYAPDDMEPYWANVIAIDGDGNEIQELKERQEVTLGDEFVFNIADSRLILKDRYHYQHKWYLTYTDRNTERKKETPIQNATDINFTMPDAESQSLATFYLIYDEDQTAPPDPTPTPPPGATPTPPIPEVIAPEPDSATMPINVVKATGSIQADVKGSNRFIASKGIPTTESLYGEVSATEYLLGYRFIKKTGIKNYPVTVRKDYILNWETSTPDEFGGSKPMTETVTVEQIITVPRAYGYWEIENLECYTIESARLNNYAFPNQSLLLSPNPSYYSPPEINYFHSSEEAYHIIPPPEVKEGIILPSQTIQGDITKPTIPIEDFSYIALTQTGNNLVRNDSLSFRQNTVMTSEIRELEAPDIQRLGISQCNSMSNPKALYRSGQVIEAQKENGRWSSTGTITYRSVARVGSNKPAILEYAIGGLNDVVIHTPVICRPTIQSNNDPYVQLVNPTNGVQLVLDPNENLSDFTVNISNFGFHSNKQGYYERDFSVSLRDPNLSYIATKEGILRNEVQFPFDIFVDVGKDKKVENDDFIKKGTWITIGDSTPRFYLPMWVEEGIYQVKCRTVAVNGEKHLERTEVGRNTRVENYVATETVAVEVSGRLYGLTIYDIHDYPLWEEIFRIPKSLRLKKDDAKYPDGTHRPTYNKGFSYTYTLGMKDSYGNDTERDEKYTFPLVNGSHPYYKNRGILKTGYMTRFSMETTGSMDSDQSSLVIKPSFYYVDMNGKNRIAVDLYYTEEILGKRRDLIKMGSELDLTNRKVLSTGNGYLGIPEEELRQTASIRKTPYGIYLGKRSAMYTFTDIRLTYPFRTYVNEAYTNQMKARACYGEVLSSGVKTEDIAMKKQRWYGEYYIPDQVHAVAKGYDVMTYANRYGVDYTEDFWLTEGYLIVNFNIYTVDENGNQRLSYINGKNYKDKGHCSMWITEGPPLSKVDQSGATFDFYAGDFLIYSANQRMRDDYNPGAIY